MLSLPKVSFYCVLGRNGSFMCASKALVYLGVEDFKSIFGLNFRAEKKKIFFFNEKLMRVLKTDVGRELGIGL